MNLHVSAENTGFYPAPANHITDDPTPRDQAVYIPSISPSYAIAAWHQKWKRPLPSGVSPGDLNFLDPKNPLFRISHAMSSAGQALLQNSPCIVQQRDRAATMLICDSGGYQIASGRLAIHGDRDRLAILRWLETHADWAMTLDVPTGPVRSPGYKYQTTQDCLKETLYNLEYFRDNRKATNVKFLNVLQGNTTQETDKWFNAVKGFDFEGWAFAGVLRHNFFNLCRRVIQMADQKLLDNRDWIHILGTNDPETAVGLTALQRSINRHINPRLRISFDTSTPFRNLSWNTVFSLPVFNKNGMSTPTVACPDARKFVGSSLKFPWPSPLADRMTLGDINVKPGQNLTTYKDAQSHVYLAHHNLASLCSSIALANRIFDSESLDRQHNIARDMGLVVAAIEKVIASQSMAELEKRRGVFNTVRKVETLIDADLERDFLDC
jgi:hypothetical protein